MLFAVLQGQLGQLGQLSIRQACLADGWHMSVSWPQTSEQIGSNPVRNGLVSSRFIGLGKLLLRMTSP